MPITISCTPLPPACWTSSSIAAMKLSPPSSEALLADVLGVQEALEAFGGGQALGMCFFFSSVNTGGTRGFGRSCHQRFCARSLMYMNSAPMVPQ